MDAQKLAIDIINKRPIYWHDLKYLPCPLWKIDPRLGLEFKLGLGLVLGMGDSFPRRQLS